MRKPDAYREIVDAPDPRSSTFEAPGLIARMLGASNGVVHGYVRRARLAGLIWPLPEGLDDEGLELLLFPAPTAASQSDRRPAPDWVYVEKELRRRSVTRLLLWEEYRAANPDGFGYTWFCTTFEAWKKRARPSMRQTHIGGEKVFVDFAGDMPPLACWSSNSTPARCVVSAPSLGVSISANSSARLGRVAGSALRLCTLEALPRPSRLPRVLLAGCVPVGDIGVIFTTLPICSSM